MVKSINSNMKPEDQLIVKKAMDSASLCLKTGKCAYTDFYDPKSASTIINVLKGYGGIMVEAFGGVENCERVMLRISALDSYNDDKNFPIKAVYIDSSKFSNSLGHRDFLGSLIGLGIDRGKIGDIFSYDGNGVVFLHSNIAEFVVNNLYKVGSKSVAVSYCEDLQPFRQEARIIKATVPSMRADAVIGEAFGLSRSKAKEMITGEKLFVNWSLVTNPSAELKEGDVLSLRGTGRAEIRAIGNKTKKDRIFLEIGRWEK